MCIRDRNNTMTMNNLHSKQDAIDQAFAEGGYAVERNHPHKASEELFLLDPLFWQALGKAMGWGGIGLNEDTGKQEWIDAVRCPRCGDWLMGEDQQCADN